MEQWKTCIYDNETFEDYKVSKDGAIQSFKNGKVRELKQRNDKDGYLLATLYKNGKAKTVRVNRLVAWTFIPNPHNLPTVNHINENKHDNRVENLVWATDGEQVGYGTRTERQKRTMTEKCGKRVRCIETGQEFDSMTKASEFLGVTLKTLSRHLHGGLKSCKGLHFEYAD